MFRPTLFYGSESQVCSKGLIRGLELADMRVLRGVSGNNSWAQWQDRISNSEIRAELGTSSDEQSLHHNILRWFGLVCWMDEGRLPRIMLNFKVEQQRPKDRLKMQ